MLVETLDLSDEAVVGQVRALLDAAERHDGHVPLSDAKRLELARLRRDGFVALGARNGPDDALVGYAHLGRPGRVRDLELVVDPGRRRDRVCAALVDRAVELASAPVRLWLREPSDDDERMLDERGFRPEDTLLQMRRPLDETLPRPSFAEDTTVRRFVPGQDEPAWLEVNNAAFASHRDQGTWTLEELQVRMAEPWFDPEGFVVVEDEQGMAGFCWTKVHERHRLGEIYVIGAHPTRHGKGLGRALVLAGLESLRERGLGTGMLYTDASNSAAVHLYESLGFDVHHVHRTYVRRAGRPEG